MGIGRALVNKLKRRKKSVNPNRGLRRQDKIDRKDEVLADSPAAYKYMRGIQRRLDDSFGQQLQPTPEKVAKEKLVLAALERVDTNADTNPDAIEVTLDAGLLREVGAKAGDIVTVLEGALIGKQFVVQSVDYGASTMLLPDDTDLSAPESGVAINIQISGVKSSYV